MKIAIMQPYFLPYLGYFQLINIADKFVVYDNVQYIKRGWMNRNRYLLNNKDNYFIIPVKKFPHQQKIIKITISKKYDREKILRKFYNAYSKAPYFEETFKLLTDVIKFPSQNFFEYTLFSISRICEHLNIKTKIVISSKINYNHKLKSENKVINICNSLNGKIYINPEGGNKIYKKENFKKFKLNLRFLHTEDYKYKQFDEKTFIPKLSIVDTLMFNSKKKVKELIDNNFVLT